MKLSRVRFGQRVAAIGGIVLLVSMFLDWYGPVFDIGDFDVGLSAFEHPGFIGGIADALLILACVVAIGGAVLSAMSRSVGVPVAMSAITTLAGVCSFLLVLGRMIFQPGPNQVVELEAWIFVALFATGAIIYGGWIAMRDEAPEPGPAAPAPATAAPAKTASEVAQAAQAAQATRAAQPAQTAPPAQPVQPAQAPAPAPAAPVQPQRPVAPVHQAAAPAAAVAPPSRPATNPGSGGFSPGLLAAGIGAVVLLISMLFDWYSFDTPLGALDLGGANAFDSPGFLGGVADLLIVVSAIAAIALSVMALSGTKSPIPAPISTIITAAGLLALVLVFGRMLFRPADHLSLEFGIFLALLSAAAIAVGGFLSMKGEGASFDQAREQLRANAQAGQQPPPPQRPPPAQTPPPQPPSSTPPAGQPPPPPPPA